MAKTVVGLFDTVQEAQNSVNDLVSAGIARDKINVVTQDTRTGAPRTGTADVPLAEMVEDTERVEKGEAITMDAVAGALFGGFGGALIGVVALAIPGLGPLVAAGPIAATLAGITAGAAGGAVIGALQTSGITHEDAHIYAEAVRRGGTLLAVHVEDAEADRIKDILDQHGAVDVEERAANYRAEGWERFDESAKPVPVSTGVTANTGTMNTGATTSGTGTTGSSSSVTNTSYVGETDRAPSQAASSTEWRPNPTDTKIMTVSENVPQASRLRSKVYEHIKT